MERIINITHGDPDGIGAAISIKTAYPAEHVKTEFVSTGGVHKALKRACMSDLPWDKIILTDVSIKLPTAIKFTNDNEEKIVKELPDLVKSFVENGGEFIVIDHHETAIPLKLSPLYARLLHADSILQVTDEYGVPISGSELASIYMLRKVEQMDPMHTSEVFAYNVNGDDEKPEVEVSNYDIFQYATRVFDLCRHLGDMDVWRDPFGFGGQLALAVILMDDNYGAMEELTALVHQATALDAGLDEVLASSSENLEYYFQMTKNRLAGGKSLADRTLTRHHQYLHEFENRVFSSHVAHYIYEKTNGVVLLRYPQTPWHYSLRCPQDFPINLARFAKKYGGGGHEKAAGFDIPYGSSIEGIIQDLIGEIEKV